MADRNTLTRTRIDRLAPVIVGLLLVGLVLAGLLEAAHLLRQAIATLPF